MRKVFGVALITSLVVLPVNSALAEQIWDVVSEFTIDNGNPNGDWSYGWLNNSDFQFDVISRVWENGTQQWSGPLNGDQSFPNYPTHWKNDGWPTSGVQPGRLSFHPGPGGEAAIARWTAPADVSGQVYVQGQFFPGDWGVMQVGVFLNGMDNGNTATWHAVNAGVFDLSLPVVPGEVIDFAVYGGWMYGNTPLEATITAVPEPSTLALLASGICGLATLAWQRRARRSKCV